MQTTTSSTLLEGLKDPRNRTVWTQYVERYRPLLVGFARKLGVPADDAEDVAQDALLEFSRSYREGKYARRKGRLRSWLFGIAHNCVRGRLRKRHAAPIGDAGGVLESLEAREDLEAIWDEEWRAAVLRQCLAEIRREMQPATVDAFELFGLESVPAAEVAERLGLTTNAVFCAKHRVLKRIREILPLMEEIW